MKHNTAATANAMAITVGAIYVVCALAVALFPEFSKSAAIAWFHGIDIGKIWTGEARGNFVLGFLTSVGGSWLVGYLFASSYNRFVK